MKRVLLALLLLGVLAAFSHAGVMVEGTYGVYSFSDHYFQNMFGTSASVTSIGIGYELGNFNFLLSGKYLNKIDNKTIKPVGMDFKLFPVMFSMRYVILSGKFQPFVGLGVSYNRYKEGIEGIGKIVELGSYIRTAKKLYINILVKSNSLNFTPPGMKVKLKGFSSEIGLTFK